MAEANGQCGHMLLPDFGRIEGNAGSGSVLHYYLLHPCLSNTVAGRGVISQNNLIELLDLL